MSTINTATQPADHAMTAKQADLVLEGGGVKGIGLAGAISVLEEQGYSFPRVAGTSAGAIVGALVAAGFNAADLHQLMNDIDYTKFEDASFMDHFGLVGKGATALFEKGIYKGEFFRKWLAGKLSDRKVTTFGDLKLSDDPGSDLNADQSYKLVVMTSDLSNGTLVRLPWDYRARYGKDPSTLPVGDAVRASMSIPFFYEPAHIENDTFVDGGMLSNFPIDTFDRHDGREPRWPTLGIKLSAKPDANQVPNNTSGTLGMAKAMMATMMNFYDRMHLGTPSVVDRTIFVDTMKIKATDFGLTQDQRDQLYANGRQAATAFLATWDFDDWKKKYPVGS